MRTFVVVPRGTIIGARLGVGYDGRVEVENLTHALLGQHLLRCALRRDPALTHHHEIVGETCGLA